MKKLCVYMHKIVSSSVFTLVCSVAQHDHLNGRLQQDLLQTLQGFSEVTPNNFTMPL